MSISSRASDRNAPSDNVTSDAPRVTRWCVLLVVVAVLSIATSPILAVYEFALGLILLAVGLIAYRVHGARTSLMIGLAMLAGPAAYITAWLLVELRD